MSKKLTIKNVLSELKDIHKTVDVGYPYYNVPQTIRRAIRLLKRIQKEHAVSVDKNCDFVVNCDILKKSKS